MNAPLTRQEFASILAKALPSSALPSVNDVPDGSIPDVYKSDKGIYQLYRAGVLSGNDDGPMPPSPGRRSLPCWSVWPTPTPESSSLWTKFSLRSIKKLDDPMDRPAFFRVTSFRRLTGPNP